MFTRVWEFYLEGFGSMYSLLPDSDRNSIDDRIRIDAETINDVIEHRLDDFVAFTVRFFSVQP